MQNPGHIHHHKKLGSSTTLLFVAPDQAQGSERGLVLDDPESHLGC